MTTAPPPIHQPDSTPPNPQPNDTPSNPTHPHSHLSPTPLYRITTLFHPRPDISETAFYTHWHTKHGPLCIPWALHYNFIEYTQYHVPAALRTALTQGKKGEFEGSGSFEACADFYVRDYEDYLAAFKDEYYQEVVRIDEDSFVDKGRGEKKREEGRTPIAISMMGVCRSIVKDGKAAVHVPQSVWDKWEEYQERKRRKAEAA